MRDDNYPFHILKIVIVHALGHPLKTGFSWENSDIKSVETRIVPSCSTIRCKLRNRLAKHGHFKKRFSRPLAYWLPRYTFDEMIVKTKRSHFAHTSSLKIFSESVVCLVVNYLVVAFEPSFFARLGGFYCLLSTSQFCISLSSCLSLLFWLPSTPVPQQLLHCLLHQSLVRSPSIIFQITRSLCISTLYRSVKVTASPVCNYAKPLQLPVIVPCLLFFPALFYGHSCVFAPILPLFFFVIDLFVCALLKFLQVIELSHLFLREKRAHTQRSSCTSLASQYAPLALYMPAPNLANSSVLFIAFPVWNLIFSVMCFLFSAATCALTCLTTNCFSSPPVFFILPESLICFLPSIRIGGFSDVQ